LKERVPQFSSLFQLKDTPRRAENTIHAEGSRIWKKFRWESNPGPPHPELRPYHYAILTMKQLTVHVKLPKIAELRKLNFAGPQSQVRNLFQSAIPQSFW
jgi:hypothetical protein